VNKDGITRSATLSSVANAARVLKAFNHNDREWGVSDLARRLAIAKSTTHRLLATLTDEGLLEQDPETGRYRVGLAIFDLAAAAQSMDLHEALLTPMTTLRNQTGETVQVAVLDGREVVYVHRLDSPNTVRLFLEVGRRNAAHSTGCGKALLAFMPPDQLERVLKNWKLVAKTPHTIVDVAVLRDDLAASRRRGYAVNRRESEAGVISVASPIRDVSSHVIAAISVAGPAERLEPHELQLAQLTMEAAATISRRLGYRGSVGAA
jgi:IclR family transcriptional regulator, KDG regulon repressor